MESAAAVSSDEEAGGFEGFEGFEGTGNDVTVLERSERMPCSLASAAGSLVEPAWVDGSNVHTLVSFDDFT